MSKLIGYDYGSSFKIFQNTTSASTNATSITYLSGVLIPNNTYQIGDFPRCNAFFEKIGANNGYDVRIYWNSTNNLSGSPVLLGVVSATTATAGIYNMYRQVKITGTTGNSSLIISTSRTDLPYEPFPISQTPLIVNIDWTIDSYIIAAASCISSSDSILVHYIRVTNN